MLATLHLTLVPNCIHFLDTNARPPKNVHKPKAKGKPSPESKHCLAPQKSLDIQMFAKELVQPPCSGALLLPAGRAGNCWSPLWPHQPCEPWRQGNQRQPWKPWKLFTPNLLQTLHSSYPTVLSSVNPKIWSYPCKSLVRRSNNEDLLTWRWAKHVNPLLPCVWIESYRISAKNSLSTLVTHLLSR